MKRSLWKMGLGFLSIMICTSVTFGQCCSLVSTSGDAPTESNFFLHDGDVYVIYGDSITDGGVYPRVLENYVLTRFPDWHVTFYNLGWGGDVASNLFRLQRDVLPIKPTAFTECMGMNDAGYSAVNQNRLDVYVGAYREMIPMLRKANPNVRIMLISAIPYENKNFTGAGDGCYAQTLRCFAQAKREVAREMGVGFIDLNMGYAEKMGLGKIVYPDFILSGDGVHPNVIGQTIMAQVILKGMNAPSLVAFAAIDASGKTPKVADTTRCQIKDLVISDKGEISFSRLAQALPCPVEATGEQAARFLDVTNFNDEINRDILMIKGLTGKAYELKINGVSIDTYSSQDLLHGVNISKPMKGPMWDQANTVRDATLERQNNHYIKWRHIWLKAGGAGSGQYDLSDKARIEDFDAKAQAAIKKQHELNQPKWMTFTLTPIAQKTVVLPEPVTFSKAGATITPPSLQPLDWTKAKVKQIDLRKVVNRAFADAVEGDGQGGWSDQGPANDLSPLPVGKQVLAGVPFDIIDPAKNNGKSMLVISRRAGQNAPASMIIPVGAKAKTLAFLHATAWSGDGVPPLNGAIHYQGGLTTKAAFYVGPQLYDWWNTPKLLAAAVNAWSGNNRSAAISVLYTPLVNLMPDAMIESVEISAPEGSQWVYGLIAITALE